ncbi:MAG TPA: hypothetical protein VKA19_11525 [Alphaproteobacteria bacterium]|nr:hypothetical protein [Alphaproteobacteria bacterium]
MVAKSTSPKNTLAEKPLRYQAEALRACLTYTLKDVSALGLVTAALHVKLAIMEIDEALGGEPEIKHAS